MERAKGIKPFSSAWKAEARSLDQARSGYKIGQSGWIRTNGYLVPSEGVWPLTYRLSAIWSLPKVSNLALGLFRPTLILLS